MDDANGAFLRRKTAHAAASSRCVMNKARKQIRMIAGSARCALRGFEIVACKRVITAASSKRTKVCSANKPTKSKNA